MPLSVLDTVAALIVIDLQKGIVALPLAHTTSDIISRAAQLVNAFRERGLPVILVNVTGGPQGRTDAGPRVFNLPDDWSELVPELNQQAGDYVISKQRVGAFLGTSLQEYLSQHNVTQVFFAGVATSGGVEATARVARDYGYNVVFAIDTMTDRDAETHRHCVEKIFPRLGETDTTENILKFMKGDVS
jgi:nicotinamidase-related amidase